MKATIIYLPEENKPSKTFEYEVDAISVDEALETIFRRWNAVDGTEENIKHRVRSLSVNDMVKLEGEYYIVDQYGWIKTTEEEAKKWMDVASKDRYVRSYGFTKAQKKKLI